MRVSDTANVSSGTWRELLGGRYLGAATVLAGGVALYATNELLTISLLPSTVADIGGRRLYAWVTTVYLVASVVAATTVSPVLSRFGPRGSYLLALSVFGLGSLGCALAPTMELFLVGRVVQGLAGGLLAGLGYAVINAALPDWLWTRASGLVSAMWGVGTLVGPAAGGLFAQFGLWRWAFGALVIMTGAIAVLVPFALPAQSDDDPDSPSPRTGIPVWSLLLLGSAAMAISVAGLQSNPALMAACVGVGAALVWGFVVVDRRMTASVLPPSVFGPGPLKWIYVAIAVLMASTMADMYVPFYGQRLAGLPPVAAGFLGAALAIGWTVGELTSASLNRRALIIRLVVIAPLVMAFGLTLAALMQDDHVGIGMLAIWAAGLMIAGTGIGIAWPHLSAWAMGCVDDPAEGGTAAAAINTVQLIAGAFGAGLAGVVVNMVAQGDAVAARWLFATFAVLAAFGGIASWRASRAGRAVPLAVTPD